MDVISARSYIGKDCSVTWMDRHGEERSLNLRIQELMFIPLYGHYLVGDTEEVCLDKVMDIRQLD